MNLNPIENDFIEFLSDKKNLNIKELKNISINTKKNSIFRVRIIKIFKLQFKNFIEFSIMTIIKQILLIRTNFTNSILSLDLSLLLIHDEKI